MEKIRQNFWKEIPITELNSSEWESICDGCAQCCAHKLECEDSGEIFKTNIVCQYLDTEQCQCSVYSERHKFVPDCIKITPENAGTLSWIPETCGYRVLAEGRELPEWHPLITGDKESTKNAGASIRQKVISEADIDLDDLEDFIVDDDYFEPEYFPQDQK